MTNIVEVAIRDGDATLFMVISGEKARFEVEDRGAYIFDGKEVVGAVASEPRFKKLYESLGMQKIFGDFYRKNI